MSEHPVIIVGGGVAGCSLLYFLARCGIGATLLEQGELGRPGASAVKAAILNPYRGRSAKPGPFDLAGLEAFWRMNDYLEAQGMESGAHRTGVLRIASNERQARTWAGQPGLSQREVRPPYRAPQGAFLAEAGGWLEPARLIAALATSAGRLGATILTHHRVERVERGRASWLIHSASGSFEARAVVLCLGAGSVAGPRLPDLERIAGDQLTLASNANLPYPLAGAVYLASDGDRVYVGGNHRAEGELDPHAPRLLRASAARMVPPLEEAPIESVWTGVRAKRPDNVPLAFRLAGNLWYLGAFGGRGFLTAPLLAERVAKALADDLREGARP